MSEGRSPSWVPNELRWLFKQIRPFFRWHLASFLCITAGSLLALLTPLVLKWLIDQIIPRREMGLLLLAVGSSSWARWAKRRSQVLGAI